MLEMSEKLKILSFYSVILLFQPHFPSFRICFGY